MIEKLLAIDWSAALNTNDYFGLWEYELNELTTIFTKWIFVG